MLESVLFGQPRWTRLQKHERTKDRFLTRRPTHEVIDDRSNDRQTSEQKKRCEEVHGAFLRSRVRAGSSRAFTPAAPTAPKTCRVTTTLMSHFLPVRYSPV